MTEEGKIIIKGAKVNNLKDITVEIPRNKLVVVTGISGSGKSSLAFDTLFAEGQRRFAESLSSYARQFLGRMSKPDVESIEGIPPAIAIEQKVNVKNPRSTVATTTEIYDYLRIIFARIGRTYSPVSGKEVKCHSVNDVADGLDHADDRQDAQHEPSLRDEAGDAGLLRWLIEINQIVIQHRGEQAHGELRQAEPENQGIVYFFHGVPAYFLSVLM